MGEGCVRDGGGGDPIGETLVHEEDFPDKLQKVKSLTGWKLFAKGPVIPSFSCCK
jgi:hypothetical protein